MTRDKNGVKAKLKTQGSRFQYYSSLQIVLNFFGEKNWKKLVAYVAKNVLFYSSANFFFLFTNFREQ